jgi:hypothetical protein
LVLGVPVWAEGVVVVGDDDDAPPRVSPERVGKDDIFDAFDDKDDDDAFGRPDDPDIVVLLWTISLSLSLSLSSTPMIFESLFWSKRFVYSEKRNALFFSLSLRHQR